MGIHQFLPLGGSAWLGLTLLTIIVSTSLFSPSVIKVPELNHIGTAFLVFSITFDGPSALARILPAWNLNNLVESLREQARVLSFKENSAQSLALFHQKLGNKIMVVAFK